MTKKVTENQNAEDQDEELEDDEEFESQNGDSDSDSDEDDDSEESEADKARVPLKEDGTPWTEKDIAKVIRAKKKADRDAKRYREELAKVKNDRAESGAEADGDAIENARLEGAKEAESIWKTPLVLAAAEAELAKAKFKGDPAKYTRFLDLESVEVEIDERKKATFTGLEDFVEDLQIEFPELFQSEDDEPPKRQARKVDHGDKKKAPEKQMTSAEILRERALNAAN